MPRRGRRRCPSCRRRYVRQYRRAGRVIREWTCGARSCRADMRTRRTSPLARMMREVFRGAFAKTTSDITRFFGAPDKVDHAGGRYVEVSSYFATP